MKSILFILLLFPCLINGQDIISKTSTVIAFDGRFYLLDSTLLDNGTNLPGLEVTRQLIGDTSQVAAYLKNKGTQEQNDLSEQMAKAFDRNQVNSNFNNYRSIYQQVTGEEMYIALEDELIDTYRGRYRVHDLVADSNFVANLVRVGPDNRYRLEHETTGQRWAILPKSERNFQINQWQGENYDMYDDGVLRRNVVRVYQPVGRIEGSPVIRIVKISN